MMADQSKAPLILRALRGEAVERTPVWMMRQAGPHMKVYQDLVKKYPSFRERSENVDLSVEITLQPWHAFKTDGVVLFSDITTPLSGMNVPFEIAGGKGPIIYDPIRTLDQVRRVAQLEASESLPFVGESLRLVAAAVGDSATVIGFVGAPFTLATYMVEGGKSKNFSNIKRMAFGTPVLLHALLEKLTENVLHYCRYQADSGAQVIQIFDSWASQLHPQDFDVFVGPHLKRIIREFKQTHPHVPVILLISGSGGLLERMADCGPDCISIHQSVDLVDGINRIGKDIAVQGNLDPGILFGSKATIEARVLDTIKRAQKAGARHVMNLGHGVLPNTPEEAAAHYFEVARTSNARL